MKKFLHFLISVALIQFYLLHGMLENNVPIIAGFTQFLGAIESCTSEPLNGGLSKNKQYLYTVNKNKYVVRILNSNEQLIRKNEILAHMLAANKKIAPAIHYYDDNEHTFFIMDYIDSPTMTMSEINKLNVLDRIAQKIRLITECSPDVLRGDNLTRRLLSGEIVRYYEQLKNTGHYIAHDPLVESAFGKVEMIRKKIECESRPLVFSHNDLHMRNMFFVNHDIMVIDWEDSGLNYEFSDLMGYSLFSCLDLNQELYLLSQYMQKIPSEADLVYFSHLKLLGKFFLALSAFRITNHLPENASNLSIKDQSHYMKCFILNEGVDSPSFFYEMAMCALQEFLKGCEKIDTTISSLS